mmetsp:Transcript_28257/g.79048  ORF Transcript_28257/g.79048 Transcript_28257/m.79048 type:complete len:230 (+) Transcript_28257:388-1077(+)
MHGRTCGTVRTATGELHRGTWCDTVVSAAETQDRARLDPCARDTGCGCNDNGCISVLHSSSIVAASDRRCIAVAWLPGIDERLDFTSPHRPHRCNHRHQLPPAKRACMKPMTLEDIGSSAAKRSPGEADSILAASRVPWSMARFASNSSASKAPPTVKVRTPASLSGSCRSRSGSCPAHMTMLSTSRAMGPPPSPSLLGLSVMCRRRCAGEPSAGVTCSMRSYFTPRMV